MSSFLTILLESYLKGNSAAIIDKIRARIFGSISARLDERLTHKILPIA